MHLVPALELRWSSTWTRLKHSTTCGILETPTWVLLVVRLVLLIFMVSTRFINILLLLGEWLDLNIKVSVLVIESLNVLI